MRIETKFSVLTRLIPDGNNFTIEGESIMNGQRYVIANWRDVRTAIQILREIDWLTPDSNSQLLDDYLANRPENDKLEMSAEEYNQLIGAVRRFDAGLPVVFNTLKAHAVDIDPSTIWVQMGRTTDPGDLADTIAEIVQALTRASQADHTFRFAGVAQGSDWLGFVPSSELMGTIINYCIHLSSSIVAELQNTPTLFMRNLVKSTLSRRGKTDEPTEEQIEEEIDTVNQMAATELIDAGVEELQKHLRKAGYKGTQVNQTKAAVKAATAAIIKLAQENRAAFEASENSRGLVINITGNERVEINQLNVPHPPDKALPSPK